MQSEANGKKGLKNARKDSKDLEALITFTFDQLSSVSDLSPHRNQVKKTTRKDSKDLKALL
jgi:hypothetical protein